MTVVATTNIQKKEEIPFERETKDKMAELKRVAGQKNARE